MKSLTFLIGMGVAILSSYGLARGDSSVSGGSYAAVVDNRELLAENDCIQILCEEIKPARIEFDVPVNALLIRKKSDGTEKKLLQTVQPEEASWYVGDGKNFVEVPIDSIPAVSNVYIYYDNPLKLIVEGCPDFRNIYSYFIDVDKRKAWYVPANSGYLGDTEEGYMIFRSYRYVSDPDIAGRYTFLQVFDEDGVMVDSLDLEHVILEKHQIDQNF